jgi:cbb3-type cytochrome oxidase subunit 3
MFTDPVALTIALILCFAAVIVLAYEAGADAQKRADWEKASADALALVAEAGSRGRHPSR